MFVEKDIDKGCFFGAKNGGFRFSVGGDANGSGTQEKVTILPDGNVGIGTATPGYLAHVDGDLYAKNYRIDKLQELS